MTPLLFGLLGGFLLGGAEVRAFESAAARDIRANLQGDAKVSVKTRYSFGALSGDLGSVHIDASHFSTFGLPLFTEPQRSKRGRVRKLHLDLTDFSLRGLHVQSLRAEIPECRYDLGLALSRRRIRLSQSGTGPGSVVVSAGDLEAFILKKYKEVKRVSVRLEGGRAIIEGHGTFLILDTDFRVDAALTAVTADQLALTDPRITFDGAPADEASQKVLLDILNPVVDLNRDLSLYGAIRIESVTVDRGQIEVSGPTTIPVKPNPA